MCHTRNCPIILVPQLQIKGPMAKKKKRKKKEVVYGPIGQKEIKSERILVMISKL